MRQRPDVELAHPCVCEAKPGHDSRRRRRRASSSASTTVPAGRRARVDGVLRAALRCRLTVQAAPVHVVAAIGVAPHGSTSIEIERGRRDGRRAARDGERQSCSRARSSWRTRCCRCASRGRRSVARAGCVSACPSTRACPAPCVTVPVLVALHRAARSSRRASPSTVKLVGSRDRGAEIADQLRRADRAGRAGLVVAALRGPALEVRLTHVRARADADRDDADAAGLRVGGGVGRARRVAGPVACPSLISTIAFATRSRWRASAVAAVLMPASCGLPPAGPGAPFDRGQSVA